MDLVAVDVVEGLGRAVHGDGDVRGELGGDVAAGGAGGHGQGAHRYHGAQQEGGEAPGQLVSQFHRNFLLNN